MKQIAILEESLCTFFISFASDPTFFEGIFDTRDLFFPRLYL